MPPVAHFPRWDIRWLAVLAGMGCNFVCSGFFRSGGIIYSAALHYFGVTRTVAAWIPMINAIIVFTTAPISTSIAKRFSFHVVTGLGTCLSVVGTLFCCFATSVAWLFVGWSFFFAFGMSLVMFPAITAGGVYFVKGRPLAVGLSLLGGPIGSFCLPPLLQILLDQYGFRGAMLLTTGITLNLFIFCLLFLIVSTETAHKKSCCSKSDTEEPMLKENGYGSHQKEYNIDSRELKTLNEEMQPDVGNSEATDDSEDDNQQSLRKDLAYLLRQPSFFVNAFSNSLHSSVFISILTALKDFAVHEMSTSSLEGAYLISATAVADLVTRVVTGVIFTRCKPRKDLTLICAMTTSIGCCLAMAWFRSYYVVMALAVVAGICYATALMLYFEIYACNFKSRYLLAVGLGETSKAFMFTLMGVVVGKLKDVTGSYKTTFLVFAALDAIAASLWCVFTICTRHTKTQIYNIQKL